MIKGIVVLWTILCGYFLFAGVGGLDTSMVESSDAYAAGAGWCSRHFHPMGSCRRAPFVDRTAV